MNAAIAVPSAAEFARVALGLLDDSILDKSGSVLYSGATTLRKGRFYFLGMNPGGAGADTHSVRTSLLRLPVSEKNAYLTENWSSSKRHYGEGGHPLQVNARALFASLGVDLSAVCASNLIFVRSTRESGSGGLDAAERCWPVHELIRQIVSPEVIIAFGALPYQFLVTKWGLQPTASRESGHGDWMCLAAARDGCPLVIGLPHLSRYALHAHPEVLDWIRERVDST